MFSGRKFHRISINEMKVLQRIAQYINIQQFLKCSVKTMSKLEWPYCFVPYSGFTYRNTTQRCPRTEYPWYEPNNAFLLHFEHNNEIGAFALLTNSYCLAAVCDSINFNSIFKDEFGKIPVVFTSIANCRVLGRLCAGNKHGLLVPNNITELELDRLKKNLPDSVKITCVEEKMFALGNLIACNDNTAVIHPELDQETVEMIADTLNVEVFRRTIAGNSLAGSYCVLNNFGGLVPVNTSAIEIEELTDLLQIPIVAGTVNDGKIVLGSGLAVNDCCALAGLATKGPELRTIETTFKLSRPLR